MAIILERTCEPGHIQISQETAELLASDRKSSWFVPREEKIKTEVKGHIQSYWLHPKREATDGKSDNTSSDTDSLPQNWLAIPDDLLAAAAGSAMLRAHLSEQNQRLAEWNSNQLLKLLNQVVLHRLAGDTRDGVTTTSDKTPLVDDAHQRWAGGNDLIIDEVNICLSMPEFDPTIFSGSKPDDNSDALPELVNQQLHDYVSIICSMYSKELPLHNYQHATTCTMNLLKLLSRMGISTRSVDTWTDEKLYEQSFGISANPIAIFGLAFANLVCLVFNVLFSVLNSILFLPCRRIFPTSRSKMLTTQVSRMIS